MIIFIHGFGSSGPTSSTGKNLVNLLPDNEITCVSYDYLNPLSDVLRIMKDINSMDENVTLIGVSLGGYIARYIAYHCSNVDRLILINPSLNATTSLKKYEGSVIHNRSVQNGLNELYEPLFIEKDNIDLPIYVIVGINDDVVDPHHTIKVLENRAKVFVTNDDHCVDFNNEIKSFINNALNIRFG